MGTIDWERVRPMCRSLPLFLSLEKKKRMIKLEDLPQIEKGKAHIDTHKLHEKQGSNPIWTNITIIIFYMSI